MIIASDRLHFARKEWLASNYIAWRIDDVKVLQEPQAVVQGDVKRNLTQVNELHDEGWAKLLGCAFTDGTLLHEAPLGMRRARLCLRS